MSGCAARKSTLYALDEPYIAYDDLVLLAQVIHTEAGSAWLPDEWRLAVGEVVLNRVASPEFPDTLEEVVFQPGQYSAADRGLVRLAHPLPLLPGGRAAPAPRREGAQRPRSRLPVGREAGRRSRPSCSPTASTAASTSAIPADRSSTEPRRAGKPRRGDLCCHGQSFVINLSHSIDRGVIYVRPQPGR